LERTYFRILLDNYEWECIQFSKTFQTLLIDKVVCPKIIILLPGLKLLYPKIFKTANIIHHAVFICGNQNAKKQVAG